ncbi:MAG: hypothetical protein NTV70_26525 [Acidobacteria bacterium]|nr:hypothetical protein [Acidobacteriota bacterium]
MRRIRFFDRENDNESLPLDWRWVAAILATLFLNFHLFTGLGSHAMDAAGCFAVAILMPLLFFAGPAVLVHTTQRSILRLLEDSIGTMPTVAVRLCAVVFLSLWIAGLLAWPVFWAAKMSMPEPSLRSTAVGAIALMFLFHTAMQSTHTTAKLALFTNKLGIVILVAALIRARDGWDAIPANVEITSIFTPLQPLSWAMSNLAQYAAPFGLLTAQYASRMPSRRTVALTILTGVTLPVFGVMLLSGFVAVATRNSDLYQPSLSPNVGMALFAHTAASAAWSRGLLVAISAFGALRLGVWALAKWSSLPSQGKLRWACEIVGAVAIAVLALWPFAEPVVALHGIAAKCLTLVGAVVTADCVMRNACGPAPRRFDPVGTIALVAGLGIALWLAEEIQRSQAQWWLHWLFPSYAVSFGATCIGRLVQRRASSQMNSGCLS